MGDPANGTRYCLCTYEHPAARHLVDDWRRTMSPPVANRIQAWEHSDKQDLRNSVEIVDIVPSERMYLVPIEGNRTDKRLEIALAMARKEAAASRPFHKVLHFGRVPVGDAGWEAIPQAVLLRP